MSDEILQQYLEFKEDFKRMNISGEFYSDICAADVQFLINIIEELIK